MRLFDEDSGSSSQGLTRPDLHHLSIPHTRLLHRINKTAWMLIASLGSSPDSKIFRRSLSQLTFLAPLEAIG